MKRGTAAFVVLILLLTVSIPAGGATSSFSVKLAQSTVLIIFSNGAAEVNQTLLPMNMSSITLPLLSAQVGNILAVSQNGAAISYEIASGNITLSTFGVSKANLIYDTDALTTKQGSVWDLNFNSPYNITLILPYQSTVLSVSRAPTSFSTVGGKPQLRLTAGVWQVSYGLPIYVPTTSSSTTATSSSKAASPVSAALQLTDLAIIAVVAAASGAAIFVLRRRPKVNDLELRADDREILSFIREKGGAVSEVEIRERFSLPRTSAWRQAKRLERLGRVRITKVGKQNRIELVNDHTEPGT